jgi:nucleotide-binding universal stress UspA family protein
MPLVSKILLPVDFSERSTGAASYARTLAGRFGSELILLHVVAPPPVDLGGADVSGSMSAELFCSMAEQAATELEAFEGASLQGCVVRRVSLQGEPADRIVELANSEKVDLIIMPTHGFGMFRRFILGSNTAKVLHDADCPVWTGVHMETPKPTASVGLTSVLAGVDLGPQSAKALGWAAALASEYGARLTVFHATACCPETGGPRIDMRKSAEAELRRLQESMNVEFDLLIGAGEPALLLCDAAVRVRADVMVIGRGSAAGVYGRLRTNAYAIIRQSPCPVVSV